MLEFNFYLTILVLLSLGGAGMCCFSLTAKVTGMNKNMVPAGAVNLLGVAFMAVMVMYGAHVVSLIDSGAAVFVY